MDNNHGHKRKRLLKWEAYKRLVGKKAARKLKARSEKQQNIWFGLGLLGLVGWSVVLPTLLGLALGIWIDQQLPSRFSWTLMLLFLGLVMGCINAWHWVIQEQAVIEQVNKKPQKEINHE